MADLNQPRRIAMTNDLPDTNMDGFNFWLKEVETTGEVDRLTRAFMASIEHRENTGK